MFCVNVELRGRIQGMGRGLVDLEEFMKKDMIKGDCSVY